VHKKHVHILYLDDNKNDAELVKRTLKTGGFECDITLAESENDFREALTPSSFDRIISDCTLPSLDGLNALRLVREKFPDTPFIFLAGTMTEDFALDSLVNGATDDVVKGKISHFIAAMERAIGEAEERRHRARAEDQARKVESLNRIITENTGDMVAVLGLDGKRIYSGPSYRSLVGTGRELRGTKLFNEVHPDDREKIKQALCETVESGKGRRSEYRFLMSDGSIRYIESQVNTIVQSIKVETAQSCPPSPCTTPAEKNPP
jgi:PAS domain S-box-containing protein